MKQLRIGISGWTYAPWRGDFFPRGLPHAQELAYASRQVNSIEINGTFYSLQRPSSYRHWAAEVPEDFVFAVKGPRFITHIRRLRDARLPLANFFASGVLELGAKLGPFLWQLPPSLKFDPVLLRTFLRQLPRDLRSARTLARRHDSHVKRISIPAAANRPLRHALEVRHASFETPEFLKLLRSEGVAIVVADTAGKWPLIEEVSADFVYVRLHGDEQLYVSGYTPAALRKWEAKVRRWKRGRDVYIYFDNDVKTRAPYDARTLAGMLDKTKRPAPRKRRGPAVFKRKAPG